MASYTWGIGVAPRKTKQRRWKGLQTTSLCYCNAKYTLKVPVTFNKVRKTKHKNFYLFIFFFFLSFFFARHNSKSIQSLWILNIPNDCSANLYILTFWALCELQVVSYGLKTVPRSLYILMCMLLGFSCINCMGGARIVRPHLDY